MRSTLLLALFSSLSLLLPACSSTPDDPVQDFIVSSEQAFTSCGSVTVPEACGEPTLEQSKAISCLIQGFSDCKPVRLDITQRTIEGDPILTTYLVVTAEGGGCYVEQFIDDRQDRFGDGKVDQKSCDLVREGEGCPWVDAEGCYGGCSGECG
jgi:hypothetical protein